ncbi:MAG: integrase core domain-containing protein [Chloroflexota bacterium]
MGSLRRECLDLTLILHRKHLTRVVKEYTQYFNQERPHQGIDQWIPNFTIGQCQTQLEISQPGPSLAAFITAISV